MGKGSRKAKKRADDFRKVKIKIGKRLKKPNVTDTSFATRKIVLSEQLAESEGPNTASANLQNALSQMSSLNKHSVRNGIETATRILSWQPPQFLSSHIDRLIRSYGGAILSETVAGNPDLQGAVYSLHRIVIGKIKCDQLRAHFDLLVAFLSCALTHRVEETRRLGVQCFEQLLRMQPQLCISSKLSLDAFLACLKCAKLDNVTILAVVEAFFAATYASSKSRKTNSDNLMEIEISEAIVKADENGVTRLCDAHNVSLPPNLNLVPISETLRDPFYFPLNSNFAQSDTSGDGCCSNAGRGFFDFLVRCCETLMPRLGGIRLECDSTGHHPQADSDTLKKSKQPTTRAPGDSNSSANTRHMAMLALRCEMAFVKQCTACLSVDSASQSDLVALKKALRKHVLSARAVTQFPNKKAAIRWKVAIDALKAAL